MAADAAAAAAARLTRELKGAVSNALEAAAPGSERDASMARVRELLALGARSCDLDLGAGKRGSDVVTPLLAAVAANDGELVALFLASGEQPAGAPLAVAVRDGHETLVDALLAAGVSARPADPRGFGPLQHALRRRDVPLAYLQRMLDAGADANGLTAEGVTLDLARSVAVASLLLASGADVNHPASSGPLAQALRRRAPLAYITCLLAAGARVGAPVPPPHLRGEALRDWELDNQPPLLIAIEEWQADESAAICDALLAAGASLAATRARPHSLRGRDGAWHMACAAPAIAWVAARAAPPCAAPPVLLDEALLDCVQYRVNAHKARVLVAAGARLVVADGGEELARLQLRDVLSDLNDTGNVGAAVRRLLDFVATLQAVCAGLEAWTLLALETAARGQQERTTDAATECEAVRSRLGAVVDAFVRVACVVVQDAAAGDLALVALQQPSMEQPNLALQVAEAMRRYNKARKQAARTAQQRADCDRLLAAVRAGDPDAGEQAPASAEPEAAVQLQAADGTRCCAMGVGALRASRLLAEELEATGGGDEACVLVPLDAPQLRLFADFVSACGTDHARGVAWLARTACSHAPEGESQVRALLRAVVTANFLDAQAMLLAAVAAAAAELIETRR